MKKLLMAVGVAAAVFSTAVFSLRLFRPAASASKLDSREAPTEEFTICQGPRLALLPVSVNGKTVLFCIDTGIAGTVASTDPTAPPNSTAHFQTRPEARTETRWLDTGVIAGANNYELLGLEGVWNYGPLHVEGEYQHVWMQRISQQDLNFGGGYIYAAWFLTGEHMAWDRQTGQLARAEPFTNFFRVRATDGTIDGGWGAWQVAVRLSHADLSNLNVHGGISNEVTYSLIWYFNSHSKLIFNCITGDIRDRRPADGQTAANFTILGTRLAVDF